MKLVHEAQQPRQIISTPRHLGQLDVAEHGELGCAVDARGLVVRIGNAAQSGVGQQCDQRLSNAKTSITSTVSQA